MLLTVRAIQNKSIDLPTEATVDVVQHKATLTEPVDNSSLAFDVKDDVELSEEDVDSQSEQIEIVDFELPEQSVVASKNTR
ncbi:MAG: hypothetical protein P1P93_11600 [Gammaproteobacteria bacterium]|nr:hypothetical protein [Gammaproteobacteria bacterium]